jgi:histone deacetylase 6
MFHNSKLIGTNEYIYIFERILFPIFEEFNADLVLVSAGFDAGRGDPVGKCSVDPEAFGYMTNKL